MEGRNEIELRSQVTALEQLLEVHEMTVIKQSKHLGEALDKLQNEVNNRKQAQRELATLNKILEQRVTDRTQELEGVNEQLQKQIDEHKKTQNSLAKALATTETILEGLPVGVVIIDRNKNIRKANKAALTIMDNKAEDVIGKVCHQFMCSAIKDRCPIIDLGHQCNSAEREVVRRDGSEVPVLKTVLPVILGDEEVLLEVFTDISDLKEAERERQIMEIQLRQAQKLEAIGQLAAGIAHEINTPIQYVGSNTQFLEEAFGNIRELVDKFNVLLGAVKNEKTSAEHIEEVEEFLEEVDWEYLGEEIPQAISQSQDGLKRVASIVQAMKEFSHPGSKEKESADLNRIIETTVTVARSEWKYVSNIEMNLDSGLPPVPLLIDEMGQVVLNLLVNGAHAIDAKLGENPEGKKGVISINTNHDGDWAEIRITDSGSGIPKKDRNLIFDPFFTTKTVGKGTGQGLAIAHDVVAQKHGGTLTFETEMGKGSTFIIGLPIKQINRLN